MKMENGEWKMNDTVYGVSPGLVLHEMYPEGQEKPLRSASPYGTASIRTFILHFPFSIFNYSEKKNSAPLYPSGTL